MLGLGIGEGGLDEDSLGLEANKGDEGPRSSLS